MFVYHIINIQGSSLLENGQGEKYFKRKWDGSFNPMGGWWRICENNKYVNFTRNVIIPNKKLRNKNFFMGTEIGQRD